MIMAEEEMTVEKAIDIVTKQRDTGISRAMSATYQEDLKNISTKVLAAELMRRARMEESVSSEHAGFFVSFAEKYWGLKEGELSGPSRTAELAEKRHIAMSALRINFGLTLQQAGDMLKRDHGSVMHGVRRVATDKSLTKRREVLVSEWKRAVE